MFDTDISATINGDEIDTPKNAITLSKSLYAQFGSFNVFFDEIPNKPHAYRIDSYKTNVRFAFGFPKEVNLQNENRPDIDPPCPRLLRIHRAVAQILHLSAAGEHIDRIIRESEEPYAIADGSTDIGSILALKLSDLADNGLDTAPAGPMPLIQSTMHMQDCL